MWSGEQNASGMRCSPRWRTSSTRTSPSCRAALRRRCRASPRCRAAPRAPRPPSAGPGPSTGRCARGGRTPPGGRPASPRRASRPRGSIAFPHQEQLSVDCAAMAEHAADYRPRGRRDRPGAARAGPARARPGGPQGARRARALRPLARQPPPHEQRGGHEGGRGDERGALRAQGGHDHARGQGRRGQPEPAAARGDRRQGDHPHRAAHPGRDARSPACTTRSRWSGWRSATPTAPRSGASSRTATRSRSGPSGSRATSAARWRSTASARPSRIHGRVYGGPKWTVSPVYEGMLKEELDAAAERHPGGPLQPGADRRDLRGPDQRRGGRAARDPGAQPRRRLPVRPRDADVRVDRRRRVGAAGLRRGLRRQGRDGRGAARHRARAARARTSRTRWR